MEFYMDRVRLNHSVFYNDEEVRELENLAAEGNVEAGIEVAAQPATTLGLRFLSIRNTSGCAQQSALS